MIRLRFSIDVEFDSVDTAKAYGVAYGWALNTITENAMATSESSAPTIRITRKVEVVEVKESPRHG